MNQHVGNKEAGAWRPALLAALAGLIVFSLLVDPSIINPWNTGWLATGDSAQSYIGWLFFRHEPWSLPLGAAHRLGLEQANSIVYSDSIPLLAITFKLFQAWLPADFQYGGMWLFGCYALQGYFACRLLMLFTNRRSVLVVGVLLFLLSPIMLSRAQSHLALTAHWIVLAAIYLYYVPAENHRLRHWLVLLWLAPLVHAYLMFMAYAIWAAYVLRHGLLDSRWTWGRLLAWMVAAVGGSLSMMWLAGYFGDMEVSTGGFGYYSMNLLAPVLPVGGGPFLLHAPAAATTGQYEGFNYLGLGVLFALVVAIAQAVVGSRRNVSAPLQGWRTSPDSALVLCCLALTALALSNVVTFGPHRLFEIGLTPTIESALNVFRASGRLFWPVYYVLLLAAMRGAARLSGAICGRLLVLVLAMQLVDFWPFIHATHATSSRRAEHDRFPVFASPFWEMAKAHYANVYVIPGTYDGDRSIPYEMLAGSHGFAIDSAYYARMPSEARRRPRQQRHAAFLQGELDRHGLYLVQQSAHEAFKSTQRLLPPGTGVGRIDGFIVVAPGWFDHDTAGYLQRPARPDLPMAALDEDIGFGKDAAGLVHLLGGWGDPGPDAVWSVGSPATLVFRVPPSSGDVRVSLDVMPYLPQAYPQLAVDVLADGRKLAHWEFVRGQPGPQTVLTIPAALLIAQDGNVALKFQFHQPRSPLQAGESVDWRQLALLLRRMRLH